VRDSSVFDEVFRDKISHALEQIHSNCERFLSTAVCGQLQSVLAGTFFTKSHIHQAKVFHFLQILLTKVKLGEFAEEYVIYT